ncbi:MAG: glycoside hydrolase family 57 protein [Desulfuromonadaceae bacterium]
MKPLKVAILWHMHQPDYRDPVSGKTLLPWTYLHAVKDYGEMLKTAAEGPGARMTFNLVPTMLEQLERYASGQAGDVWIEAAAKSAADLSDQEKRLLLSQFFSVHADRHIQPFRRYRELARRRGNEPHPDPGGFSEQDFRDLQVWFLLAWSGHHLRRDSSLIKQLLIKGEQFSEAEKAQLLDLYDRTLKEVVKLYRRMEENGSIEISVTPYAHPILPLLCGTANAREATPGIQLPAATFLHAEDAHLQVRLGLDFVSAKLGAKKRGMWPSEGSVSPETIRILAAEGAAWAATDEGILARSLPGGLSDRRQLYRPYAYAGLPLIFRDRELSDRIGFVYAHWNPQRAADDLIEQLKKVAKIAPGGLIPLILDGENCWERYQDNGHPFLIALYQGLLAEPSLRMVTVSEALQEMKPKPLTKLAAGSWINSDFCIWIGHSEENTAWDWLERARRDALEATDLKIPQGKLKQPLPEIFLHLLRAEGSDWFWWYGDDHATDQADIFDALFRRHLQALYREAGLPIPQHLYLPIKPAKAVKTVREPTALFTPHIDGHISDYFEWLAAGSAGLTTTGAMHSAHRNEFSTLLYGYDLEYLYLRLDPEEDLASLLGPQGCLEVRLGMDRKLAARVNPCRGELVLYQREGGKKRAEGKTACGRIVEMAIPLAPLQLRPGTPLELSIHLFKEDKETARWPAEGPLLLPYRGETLGADDWLI